MRPPAKKRRQADAWDRDFDKTKVSAKELRRLKKSLRDKCSAEDPKPDRTAMRYERLGKMAGFERTDLEFLKLLLRYQTHTVFE